MCMLDNPTPGVGGICCLPDRRGPCLPHQGMMDGCVERLPVGHLGSDCTERHHVDPREATS